MRTPCPVEAAEWLVRMGLAPMASHVGLGSDAAARRILAAGLLRSRALFGKCVATLKAAGEALKGIPYVVIKGPPVGRRYYPSAELRESVDVDVLASKRDHREIEKRLSKLGYEADRSRAVGSEVTFLPRDAALVCVDFHFELWTSKPTLAEVLKGAEEVEVGGVRVPVSASRVDVELLATHYLRDLGDRPSRLLDVLLARRATGVEIAHEATRRIVLRDAKQWFGIGEAVPAPRAPWGWIDQHLQETDPGKRQVEVVGAKARMLRLLVAWLQKPSRGIARTLLAMSPATAASGSWGEDEPGWQLRRLGKFVRDLVGGRK